MPLRQIVADTETTGLYHAKGDRMIEVGAIELIDYIETGRTFHQRFNPQRSIPAEATAVHGITDAEVANEPLFSDAIDAFLDFIGDSELVIHNGKNFDAPFLNAELARAGRPPIKNVIVDTLDMARRKFGQGARANLDALADRFGIDRSFRHVHGALIDCVLLSRVYVALLGRDTLLHGDLRSSPVIHDSPFFPENARQRWFKRNEPVVPDEAEAAANLAFLGKISDPLWKTFEDEQVV